MKQIVIVIYFDAPTSSEGDDDPKSFRVVRFRTRARKSIPKKRAEALTLKLSEKYACHTQVWDIY